MARKPAVIPMSDASEAIQPHDVAPTILPDAFLTSEVAQTAVSFHMPRFDELPCMTLYRDQVITYVEQVFSPFESFVDGPWISGAMINNYVKSGLVPAPTKKQYGRDQVARILVICVFKQILPMSAIQRLFNIQRMTYRAQVAYDYVATELEHALVSSFGQGEPLPDSASRVTRESLLVRSAASAFASKAYLLGYLNFSGMGK